MKRGAPEPSLQQLSDAALQARCGTTRWERLVGWVLPWPWLVGAFVVADVAAQRFGRVGACAAVALAMALAVLGTLAFTALGGLVPERLELVRRFGAAPVEYYVRQVLAQPPSERPSWTVLLQWDALPRGGRFLVSAALRASTVPWSTVEARGVGGSLAELTRAKLLKAARPLTETERARLLRLVEARAGTVLPPGPAVKDGAPCRLVVVDGEKGAVHVLRFNLASLPAVSSAEDTTALARTLLALEASLRPSSSLPPGVGVVER